MPSLGTGIKILLAMMAGVIPRPTEDEPGASQVAPPRPGRVGIVVRDVRPGDPDRERPE